MAYRGRTRTLRSNRRREDDEDAIQVNWASGPEAVLRETLSHIVFHERAAKAQTLAYLNCFTKLCIKFKDGISALGFTLEEIYSCLRVAVIHEAVDVRAAGFRGMRYLVMNKESVAAFNNVNLPLLVVRSLDVVLENKIERLQALRLARKILAIDPSSLSSAIIRCLITIGRDGLQERDILTRSCWAALSEIILLNPEEVASSGGIDSIFPSVLLGNQSSQINEALIGCILFQLNFPKSRSCLKSEPNLQFFISSFTDCYTSGTKSTELESNEQKELRLLTSRKIIVSVLRSWPGLVFLCNSSSDQPSHSMKINGIQSIIDSLKMPYPEVRRHILDMFFELLGQHIPSNLEDFEDALVYIYTRHGPQEQIQLYDGFVCCEAVNVLPNISKTRVDLCDNYLSLVLQILIYYGLPEALISVIIKPKDISNSIRSAILLGSMLNLSSRLLPLEIAQKCHSLPDLVNAATSTSSTFDERNLAAAAITFLDKVKLCRKVGLGTVSLYLDHIIKYCSIGRKINESELLGKEANNISPKRQNAPNDESLFNISLRDTNVFNRDPIDWDWHIISHVVSWPSESFKKLEEEGHRKFLLKLIAYFKPSSQLYSRLDAGDAKGRQITEVGCSLFKFFAETADSKSNEYLEVLLSDLMDALNVMATADSMPVGAILGPTRLISTHSQFYFLFIGIVSSYEKGRAILYKFNYEGILAILIEKPNEVLAKLIITSLDYSNKNSFSRSILLKALESSAEGTRIYATDFTRVLLRAGLDDFNQWLLTPLVKLLNDDCARISSAAMDILDEACEDDTILDSLVGEKLNIAGLGDSGRLLLCRFAGCSKGFALLSESNRLKQELDYWVSALCFKYVSLVEHLLNESLTSHYKSHENTYGRRSERKCLPKSAFLPPHIFGQLVRHMKGVQFLNDSQHIDDCLKIIKRGIEADDSSKILELKSALWTVGHVSTSELGLRLLRKNIFQDIVTMASSHPVLSLRGTCFYVLGLISSNPSSSSLLKDLGWNPVLHDRSERWPLATKDFSISILKSKRLNSLSSCDTRTGTSYKSARSVSKVGNPMYRRVSESSPPPEVAPTAIKITPCDSTPISQTIDDEMLIPPSSLDTESSFTLLRSPLKLSPIMSIASSRSKDEDKIRRTSEILTPDDSVYDDNHSNFNVYVGIQRQRVHSLGLTAVNSMVMHHPPSSIGYSSEEDDPYNASINVLTGAIFMNKTTSQNLSEDSSDEKRFMGICLPSSLEKILEVPLYEPLIEQEPAEVEIILHDTGLELHSVSKCLTCYNSISHNNGERVSAWKPPTTMDRARSYLNTRHLETVVSASATSTSSAEGNARSPISPTMNLVTIRREVLKAVTNLSGSVAARSAEQTLLNLKQKYSEEFQDICLYTEVALQLANYNFRLPYRRFLQELFLDLNFEPIKQTAREMLSHKLSLEPLKDSNTSDVHA